MQYMMKCNTLSVKYTTIRPQFFLPSVHRLHWLGDKKAIWPSSSKLLGMVVDENEWATLPPYIKTRAEELLACPE